MVEKFIEELNIDRRAINVLNAIYFLITSEEDLNEFRAECLYGSMQDINNYLIKKRRTKLNTNKYADVNEFIYFYNIDNASALERLCQERIDDIKMSKLKSNDPKHIYAIHSSRGEHVRFMELVLFA
ncbi:UNVERIFIED_CONTAM: hypothetical protein ABIC26_002685 [Paenibacillus sp. PvR008]